MVLRFRLAALAAAVAVFGAATVGCGGSPAEAGCTTADGVVSCPVDARTVAPAVTGELLDGGRYDLAAQRGKVVVVNFWGSWCAPCRAEIADLEEVYQATKARGVEFLGINIRDDRDKALAFQRGRVTYPSLFDPSSRLALDFEIPPNAIPATIVLDRQGRIARVIRTPVRTETLRPIVDDIAAEP